MRRKIQYEKYKHNNITLTKTWNGHKEEKYNGNRLRKGKTCILYGLDFSDDQDF